MINNGDEVRVFLRSGPAEGTVYCRWQGNQSWVVEIEGEYKVVPIKYIVAK